MHRVETFAFEKDHDLEVRVRCRLTSLQMTPVDGSV